MNKQIMNLLIFTILLLSCVGSVSASLRTVVNPFNFGRLDYINNLNSTTEGIKFSFNWSDDVHRAIDFSTISGESGNLTVENEVVTLVNKQKFILNESVSVLNHQKTISNETVTMVNGVGTLVNTDYTTLISITNATDNVWNIGSDANLTSSGVLSAMNTTNQSLYVGYTRGLPHARGQVSSTDNTYLVSIMNASEDTAYTVGTDANLTTTGVLTINNVVNGTYRVNYTQSLPPHAYGVLGNNDNVVITGFSNGTKQFVIGTEVNGTLSGVLSVLNVANTTNDTGAVVNTYLVNYSHSAIDYLLYYNETNNWGADGLLKSSRMMVNTFLSLFSDATNSFVVSSSSGLVLGAGGSYQWNIESSSLFPNSGGNSHSLGSTSREIKKIYLGEGADSGIYLGLSQDAQIYFNRTTNETVILGGLGTNPNNIKIGAGVDSHSLTSGNDLFVTGKLEVDGNTYLDGVTYAANHIYMSDDKKIYFGSGSDTGIQWITPASEDTLQWAFGDVSRSLIMTTMANIDKDHDHTGQDDPTLFIHSRTDPDLNNQEWMSLKFSSNTNESLIDTGVGSVKSLTDFVAHQDLTVESDLIVGDSDNTELFYIEANGTKTLIVADSSVPMILDGVDTLIGSGDNIRIGDAGTDSHSLTSNDDLFISGKLEVDGISYIDGASLHYGVVLMSDDFEFQIGSNSDTKLDWSTVQSPDSLVWGLGVESNGLIITEMADVGINFAHLLQDDPTIFLQGSSGTNNWSSLSYSSNDNYFEIDTSSTSLGTKILADTTAHQNLNVQSDLNVGDVSNQKLFSIVVNGTHVVIDKQGFLESFVFNGNITVSGGGMLWGNSTCITLSSPSGTASVSACD